MDELKQNIVLEGGAVESNGAGVILTTEAVLLNDNRNGGLGKQDYLKCFADIFGTKQIIWLQKGLFNDETDGHIDNIARFFKEDGLLLATEKDIKSADYSSLLINKKILEKTRLADGGVLETVELPLPDPIFFNNKKLPASYLNFFITNGKVLVPTFAQAKNDARALKIISSCFQKHSIEGFDCRDFLQEGGAIHCLTQQQYCS